MENVAWNQYYKPSANLNLQGNPALDDLRQQYAQRQAQKQQENADFTKEIAKLNFNGSRDSDHGPLQQQYGDVIGTFAKLRNENDPKIRAQLGLELQQKQNQFLYEAENSKVKGQHEQELINLTHRPDVELQDGVLDKITALTKTPYGKEWEQKYNDINQNLLAPKVDLGKIAGDTYKEIAPPKEKKTLDAIKDKVTGEYRTPTVETTKPVDKDAYAKGIVSKLVGNHAAQRAIMKEFPGSDIKDATQKYIDATYPMFNQKSTSDTTYSSPYESFGQKIELSNIRANASNPPSPQQQSPQTVPIQFKVQNADGSPMTVNFKNYRAVAIPKATVIPTKGINEHGEHVNIPAGEYRVVGYADMPVVKGGEKKGQVVQPNFEKNNPSFVEYKPIAHIQVDHKGITKNYYVDPNSINVNATGQKNQQKAINRSGNQNQSNPKEVSSQTDYDALPKGAQYIHNGKVYTKK